MCHIPEQGFASNEVATSVGVEGRSGRRNAPTVLNVVYQKALFHDGREVSLETQVIGPFLARHEMANPSIGLLVTKIGGYSDYDGLFEQAFDASVSSGAIGRAIAWWQRSLLAGGSSFDRWYFGGEETAMRADARAGFLLFTGKAGCDGCHTIGEHDALFSDHGFHDTGIGFRADAARRRASGAVSVALAPSVTTDVPLAVVRGVGVPRDPDGGRAEVTGDPADLWRYKTPSLRNVALTAPYMHDGSLPSLDAVVRYYDGGGTASPGRDPRIRPLGLSEGELLSLVRFLEALTSPDIADLIADARSAPIGE
jgi:cytochrome c peroxidase